MPFRGCCGPKEGESPPRAPAAVRRSPPAVPARPIFAWKRSQGCFVCSTLLSIKERDSSSFPQVPGSGHAADVTGKGPGRRGMLLESPAQHRAQGPRWAAWAAGTGKDQDGEGPNQTGNSEAPQSPPRPPRHTEDGAAPSTPPKARRSLGMHPGAGGTTLSTSWERQLPAREQTQHPGALLQHLPAPSRAVLHRATRSEEGAERRPSAPRARAQVTPAPPGHSTAPQALPRRPQAP